MNSRPEKSMLRAAGFTLIETLVVLGIITVLIGISVPTLRGMREEARSTECRTTLREIGLGLSAYRANMNDRIPSCEPLPAVIGDETEGGLPEVLEGYLDKDCTCWLCGADGDPESTVTGTSYLYVPGLLRYSPQIQIAVAQALIPYLENPDWNPTQLELLRRTSSRVNSWASSSTSRVVDFPCSSTVRTVIPSGDLIRETPCSPTEASRR